MPQVINTNLASLNAQRNLEGSSSSLAVSLQRLSSGLRINSAKDDAAGLAIATRFSSRIQGLTQASRNANDAISLAQVSEGALQETTRILQRARELSIQSANGSNSAADRKALQAEVNQLKNELNRIGNNTSFNGLKILNGDLTNTEFQIGAEANQTVSVSITDTRTTAIGTNQVKTNNTDGVEQATYRNYIGSGTSTDDAGIGTDTGVASDGDGNNYTAETLTVANTNTSGVAVSQTVTTTAEDTADQIAAELSALTGVTATAYNEITLSNYVASDTDDNISLRISGDATDNVVDSTINIISGDSSDMSFVAEEINSDTDLAAIGVYAVSTGTSVTIYATQGQDLAVGIVTGTGSTIDINGAFDNAAASTLDSDASTQTRGGRLEMNLDQGYAIQSDGTGLISATAATNLTPTSTVGRTDITDGNNVAAQTLTISGSTGSASVSIIANEEASAMVTKINAVTGTTNVKATAITTATLQNLSQDGTVTFDLFGDNVSTAPASISAAITTTDFTALVKAINDVSGNTGISAAIDGANNVVKLTNSTGKDISIKNFTHTSGVDYLSASTSSAVIATGDGSSVQTTVEASLDVVGNSATNSGTTVKLYDGGQRTASDSAVIGGEVTFNSSATFSVTSNVDGASNPGSLFSGTVSSGNSSTAQTVNTVDISSAAGAQSAIAVLDEAINQISEVRADLGAVQSRFESAIRNLTNNVENLNVARSRILDTDFASETATLTKNQILTQAGVSILAQANALPQNVLALLQ